MKKLLIAFAMTGMLAACSTTKTTDTTATVEDRKPTAVQPTQPTRPQPQTSTVRPETTAANPLRDPNNILSKRSVYFDFDQFVVKDEFRPMVTAHAKYLSSNPSTHMTIQGNTDERGSREYNLALGQKRADAVKQMMVLSGAPGGSIETVSFGEEKPHNAGHDEAAWAENRRADIVYPGE